MLCVMSILFLTPMYADAATVDQALNSPESGWQRYDDPDREFKYIGAWSNDNNSSYSKNFWKGTGIACIGGQVTFKFYGTKLRIIGDPAYNKPTNNIVIIDGIATTFNEYSATSLYQTLLYEKTGLTQGIHTVVIKTPPNMPTSQNLFFDAIDIDDSGYIIDYYNLTATPGNTQVSLKWDAIPDATGYVIHYGKTSGNLTESKTVTGSAILSDIITGLDNGTKYYFTVSAIINGTEITPSTESPAIPFEDPTAPDHVGNFSTLILTMTNGGLKSYDLSINDLDAFLTWYDKKSDGTGKAYYVFNKTTSIAPYLRIKEYISFDKISSFEVKEFN